MTISLAQDALEKCAEHQSSVVRYDIFAIGIRHGSGALSSRNGHGDDAVFPSAGEFTAGTSSEEKTLKWTTFENAVRDQCGARRAITGVEQKEKPEDEEQRGLRYKAKDCVAARMAEDWKQEQSCDRSPCWTWMKATYLDDEQWYRVDDETSLENGLEFEETSASGFETETVDEEERVREHWR